MAAQKTNRFMTKALSQLNEHRSSQARADNLSQQMQPALVEEFGKQFVHHVDQANLLRNKTSDAEALRSSLKKLKVCAEEVATEYERLGERSSKMSTLFTHLKDVLAQSERKSEAPKTNKRQTDVNQAYLNVAVLDINSLSSPTTTSPTTLMSVNEEEASMALGIDGFSPLSPSPLYHHGRFREEPLTREELMSAVKLYLDKVKKTKGSSSANDLEAANIDAEVLKLLLEITGQLQSSLSQGFGQTQHYLETAFNDVMSDFIKGDLRQARYKSMEFFKSFGEYQDSVKRLNDVMFASEKAAASTVDSTVSPSTSGFPTIDRQQIKQQLLFNPVLNRLRASGSGAAQTVEDVALEKVAQARKTAIQASEALNTVAHESMDQFDSAETALAVTSLPATLFEYILTVRQSLQASLDQCDQLLSFEDRDCIEELLRVRKQAIHAENQERQAKRRTLSHLTIAVKPADRRMATGVTKRLSELQLRLESTDKVGGSSKTHQVSQTVFFSPPPLPPPRRPSSGTLAMPKPPPTPPGSAHASPMKESKTKLPSLKSVPDTKSSFELADTTAESEKQGHHVQTLVVPDWATVLNAPTSSDLSELHFNLVQLLMDPEFRLLRLILFPHQTRSDKNARFEPSSFSTTAYRHITSVVKILEANGVLNSFVETLLKQDQFKLVGEQFSRGAWSYPSIQLGSEEIPPLMNKDVTIHTAVSVTLLKQSLTLMGKYYLEKVVGQAASEVHNLALASKAGVLNIADITEIAKTLFHNLAIHRGVLSKAFRQFGSFLVGKVSTTIRVPPSTSSCADASTQVLALVFFYNFILPAIRAPEEWSIQTPWDSKQVYKIYASSHRELTMSTKNVTSGCTPQHRRILNKLADIVTEVITYVTGLDLPKQPMSNQEPLSGGASPLFGGSLPSSDFDVDISIALAANSLVGEAERSIHDILKFISQESRVISMNTNTADRIGGLILAQELDILLDDHILASSSFLKRYVEEHQLDKKDDDTFVNLKMKELIHELEPEEILSEAAPVVASPVVGDGKPDRNVSRSSTTRLKRFASSLMKRPLSNAAAVVVEDNSSSSDGE